MWNDLAFQGSNYFQKTELQIFFILGNSLYFSKIVETMSFIPNALNSMSFFDTHSLNQWGLYFLPLNLSTHVTVVVVTLGHKNTMPSHHNITHFHLVLLRCPCLTQLPYCEEAQLAMQKNSSHGEDLRPPAYNSGRAASQEPAPPSPCEWAPFKVDPVASVEPTQLSLLGRMLSH